MTLHASRLPDLRFPPAANLPSSSQNQMQRNIAFSFSDMEFSEGIIPSPAGLIFHPVLQNKGGMQI